MIWLDFVTFGLQKVLVESNYSSTQVDPVIRASSITIKEPSKKLRTTFEPFKHHKSIYNTSEMFHIFKFVFNHSVSADFFFFFFATYQCIIQRKYLSLTQKLLAYTIRNVFQLQHTELLASKKKSVLLKTFNMYNIRLA